MVAPEGVSNSSAVVVTVIVCACRLGARPSAKATAKKISVVFMVFSFYMTLSERSPAKKCRIDLQVCQWSAGFPACMIFSL
jgi:hypothetical protein